MRLSSAETQVQAQCIADKLNDTLPQSLLHDTAEDLRKARVHDLEQEVAELQQRLDEARRALTEAQVTEANAKLDLEATEAAVGAYRASRGSPDTSRQDDTEYKPSEPSQPGWDFKTQFKNAVNASDVAIPSSSYSAHGSERQSFKETSKDATHQALQTQQECQS